MMSDIDQYAPWSDIRKPYINVRVKQNKVFDFVR